MFIFRLWCKLQHIFHVYGYIQCRISLISCELFVTSVLFSRASFFLNDTDFFVTYKCLIRLNLCATIFFHGIQCQTILFKSLENFKKKNIGNVWYTKLVFDWPSRRNFYEVLGRHKCLLLLLILGKEMLQDNQQQHLWGLHLQSFFLPPIVPIFSPGHLQTRQIDIERI